MALLVQWNLYDVLLNDLPLGDLLQDLQGPPLTAQAAERAAPGQGEGPAARCLHGLPTRDLIPLPGLSLQTFDSLEKRENRQSERVQKKHMKEACPLHAQRLLKKETEKKKCFLLSYFFSPPSINYKYMLGMKY